MTVTPYAHQLVGIQKLVEHPHFFLADEMGAGKTLQVIYAAQDLYEKGIIDTVLVIAPATVRSVWYDPELGELKKHLWPRVPATVMEFHAKTRVWHTENVNGRAPLRWVITNYDFIRSKNRMTQLKNGYCSHKTLLVLDESSAVKNYRALQTKACMELRKRCGRVVLLNGTPIENNPGDLFSQGRMMDPKILDCDTWFHFRSRYAVLGGWMNKQIVKWNNIPDIQQRFAPHVLRRLKRDCLDLPEKLPAVSLPVPLTEETWGIYREMRDEMVAWLSHQTVAISAQAGVKAMRLAQITSGFLGGVQEVDAYDLDGEAHLNIQSGRPDFIPGLVAYPEPLRSHWHPGSDVVPLQAGTREIGREKLDLVLSWVKEQLEVDPYVKILLWCRFRPELHRLERELLALNTVQVGLIHGGQKKPDRERALRLLDPRTAPKEPVVVAGTLGSGARGLNLAASHTVLYVSNDFRLGTYLQSTDRVHRPGQLHKVSYFDVIATGPNGQRTIDHMILKARERKEDLANMTCNAWVEALTAT